MRALPALRGALPPASGAPAATGSGAAATGAGATGAGATGTAATGAAASGAAADVTETLHRIEPATVRREVEAAGFRFEGESAVLANPADPHTAGVFDTSIRGHTDQFIYKFRKPRS